MNREAFHQEPARRSNYEVSGALCRFLLEYKNGIYAADFLEYLYDSYQQRPGISLEKFIDVEVPAVDKEFRAYLAGCDSYTRSQVADRTARKEQPQQPTTRTPSGPSASEKQPNPPKGNPFERGPSADDNNPFK